MCSEIVKFNNYCLFLFANGNYKWKMSELCRGHMSKYREVCLFSLPRFINDIVFTVSKPVYALSM